jgi:tRNA pseudouridine38-40 synthase
MVRIIAGTLMQIGRGKGKPSDIKEMLEKKDRGAAGPTAPAQGLFLMKYVFVDGIPEPDKADENGAPKDEKNVDKDKYFVI